MIKFKKLREDAILPSRKHSEDAGFDICSVIDLELNPGEQGIFPTGLELVDIDQPIEDYLTHLPVGGQRCALFAWSKSSLDAKFGLHIGAGVIDHIFRGEILLCLKNMGKEKIIISAGQPLAQLVPMVYMQHEIEEVRESGASERGSDGGINREFSNVEINYNNSKYKKFTLLSTLEPINYSDGINKDFLQDESDYLGDHFDIG